MYVFMYLCIYVFMYLCIYVFMYLCIYVFTTSYYIGCCKYHLTLYKIFAQKKDINGNTLSN
jgi:hypothetical protein